MNPNLGRENLEAKLKELFIKSQTGEAAVYEDFLHLASVVVKSYLFYLGRSTSPAETLEDLHQEVIMSIHQKKQTYRPERPILPWIYSVTRHRYIDYYRAKKRAPISIEYDDQFYAGILPNFEFQDIFEYLSPRQREMLELVKLEGLSYQDAAQSLGMSVPSVKVGVHRIIKSLQQRMRK